MCPRGTLKHSFGDCVISVSALGLRDGRNLDRLQRTYYQGGILPGEAEDSCICSVLYMFCLSDACECFCCKRLYRVRRNIKEQRGASVA